MRPIIKSKNKNIKIRTNKNHMQSHFINSLLGIITLRVCSALILETVFINNFYESSSCLCFSSQKIKEKERKQTTIVIAVWLMM